jgi:antitoxin component of RelBE/YafQ-DinJ toxin-antitoxin module
MAISKEKDILQIIVDKKTKKIIKKYCNLFGLSVSQFCNMALCEKIIFLLNRELKN